MQFWTLTANGEGGIATKAYRTQADADNALSAALSGIWSAWFGDRPMPADPYEAYDMLAGLPGFAETYHVEKHEVGANASELIDLAEVKRLSHMTESTIFRRAKAGTFPKQVKLGPKTSRWIRAEVEQWI